MHEARRLHRYGAMINLDDCNRALYTLIRYTETFIGGTIKVFKIGFPQKYSKVGIRSKVLTLDMPSEKLR